MLFYSYEFIFGFLPVVFAGFVIIHKLLGRAQALLWLIAASFFFYAQWSPLHALLLGTSIVINYGFARALSAQKENKATARTVLLAGVTANLGALGYFKYTDFLLENVNVLAGTGFSNLEIFLPVGISFYTFIQIGYLVETYNRQVNETRLADYALFASFFPYITAGPIVLQREMIAQYTAAPAKVLDPARIAVALSVFGIGLFKKLALADSIAPYADTVFNGVAGGAPVPIDVAWVGSLAYTLQLYFGFSGYSDMALGVGLLFGLKLPLNFNSPLKAGSIMEFWRRWHMTMTRFFTNYLYTPLAVSMMRRSLANRYGSARRFLLAVAMPISFTFLLAGIWHGAGWTFVVFGLIHGVALAVNHAWHEANLPRLPHSLGWLLTMGVVVTGLVVFRAPDMATATAILLAMTGLDSLFGPSAALATVPVAVDLISGQGWILLLAAIALICPNAQQIMRSYWYSSDPAPEEDTPETGVPAWIRWRLTPGWALAGGIVLTIALASLSGDTQFVYYQF